MKHIIISIRYSLLLEKSKDSWKIGKNQNVEEYKKTLFAQDRLNIRKEVFEKITLASLKYLNMVMPTDISFKVHLLTSDELPENHKQYLENLSKQNAFLEVKYHSSKAASLHNDFNLYLNQNIKLGELYASVRLDDDDALSIAWLESIIKYLDHSFDNTVISMCGGCGLLLSNNSAIVSMSKMKWRFLAAGLAYIGVRKSEGNLNIFSCGSHTKVDDKFPTILDSSRIFFLRSYNEYNDSNDPYPQTDIFDVQDRGKILKELFGIS